MDEQRCLVDFDSADVVEDLLIVRGSLPPGCAVALAPRRYKSLPEWMGVEVMGVGAGNVGAAGQHFELSCAVDGLWGSEGIEVVGETATVRIPRY